LRFEVENEIEAKAEVEAEVEVEESSCTCVVAAFRYTLTPVIPKESLRALLPCMLCVKLERRW
jgi:hypothetical protein